MSDHTLKVTLGEFETYQLICHLDASARCHQVCDTHPDDGCYDPDDESKCVLVPYENGCTLVEWIDAGGIEAVEFDYTLTLPVRFSSHPSSCPIMYVVEEEANG